MTEPRRGVPSGHGAPRPLRPPRGGENLLTRISVILGCPRSGTTFLVRALQPLARTEALTGLIYPPALAHLAAVSPAADVQALLEYSLASALDDFVDFAARSRAWTAGAVLSGNARWSELATVLRGRRRPVDALVFKEPFLAFAPELVCRALPEARIVHIHRDGRDCADSLERKYAVLTDEKLAGLSTNEAPMGRKVDHRYVPWWVAEGAEDDFLARSPYVRSVWMWREIVRRCHDAFGRPDMADDGRVLAVGYEALMADPIAVGHAVVAHLGLTPNRGVDKRLGTAHARSVGIHRRRGQDQVVEATELAGPELARLGYEV